MPDITQTTRIVFTRNELLNLNSQSLPLSRKVRKSLSKSKLWCPRNQRLAITKPKKYLTCSDTKCCLLNARSINNKECSISDLLITHDLDFLFLTETWCHDNSSVSIELVKPQGYDGKFGNREGKGGEGVGCIYRTSVDVKEIPSKKCTTFDHIVLKLQYGKETLKAIIIYKPDGVYSQKFHSEFTELLTIQLARDSFKPLVLGDFNIHVNTPEEASARKFLETISAFDFNQHVNFPTHLLGNTLDLIITREDLGITNLSTDSTVRSDHQAILFKLKSPRPGLPQQSLQYRSWAKVDIASFADGIYSSFESFNPENIESAVDTYNSTFQALADKHAPLKTRTVTLHPDSPWYSDPLKEEKRKRQRLERQAKRTKLQVHWDLHNEQRDKYNLMLESAQSLHYRQSITEAASSRDKWRTFNKLLGNSSSSPLPAHSSKQELSDQFNSFFTDKIKTIRVGLAENPVEYPDHLHSTRAPFTGTPMEEFKSVSEDEVGKIIGASPSSSCRLDPLPTWML